MLEILINWIKENPAFAEDSDNSYHNREQMMEFAKHYHRKQLKLYGVVYTLPIKEENNYELEKKIEKYKKDYNFKNLQLEDGYKIGWKECYNSLTK